MDVAYFAHQPDVALPVQPPRRHTKREKPEKSFQPGTFEVLMEIDATPRVDIWQPRSGGCVKAVEVSRKIRTQESSDICLHSNFEHDHLATHV